VEEIDGSGYLIEQELVPLVEIEDLMETLRNGSERDVDVDEPQSKRIKTTHSVE
jgi:hypothetical protein